MVLIKTGDFIVGLYPYYLIVDLKCGPAEICTSHKSNNFPKMRLKNAVGNAVENVVHSKANESL